MPSRHPMNSRRTFLQAAAALAAALPFATYAQSGTKLKIGTLGAGRVGSALGRAWVKAGHEVMFSSIDIEADKKLAASIGKGAYAGTPREAAAFGSVVLVSVPYAAMPAIGRDLGDLLKGKVIIDTSNPIVARDGDMAVAAREKGAGLASTEFLPGTRIVRAFNAIGAARMGDAMNNKERIGMPIAGDDAKAIEIASGLVRDVGYEPVLVGTLAAMGKYLIPGTPLAGERSPDEVRKVAATLK
ncbi:MAG: twin-arginine translocation signal domain-containing protein [Betaproteobacteria bacterium]|nr:twin-arginine translocation signal domain-containing protein [Betaproteobacteria bacterium]